MSTLKLQQDPRQRGSNEYYPRFQHQRGDVTGGFDSVEIVASYRVAYLPAIRLSPARTFLR
jgi:hypothetical protein